MMLHDSSTPEPGRGCVEHENLFAVYARTTAEYLRTIQVLHSRRGDLPGAEYGRLTRAVEDAHARSEEARAAVQEHASKHGCFKHGQLTESKSLRCHHAPSPAIESALDLSGLYEVGRSKAS